MLMAVTNPGMPEQQKLFDLTAANPVLFRLSVTLDYTGGLIRLEWFAQDATNPQATLRIRCTGPEKLPDQTQAQRTRSNRVIEEDNVPPAVSKLLPPDQVDEKNARAQAKLFADELSREKGQLDKTESASRE